jgi:hypothetical protein
VTSVYSPLSAVFQTKTTSSQWLISELFYDQFQYIVQQISQSYQSLSPHLLPYPQDTPKTVQDQQQQEQLKINTGFFMKDPW